MKVNENTIKYIRYIDERNSADINRLTLVLITLVPLGGIASSIGPSRGVITYILIPVLAILLLWRSLFFIIHRRYRMHHLLYFGACFLLLSIILSYLLHAFLVSCIPIDCSVYIIGVFVSFLVLSIVRINISVNQNNQRINQRKSSMSPAIIGIIVANLLGITIGRIEQYTWLFFIAGAIAYLFFVWLFIEVGLSFLVAFIFSLLVHAR